MALRMGLILFSGFFLALIAVQFPLSVGLIASEGINPPYPKAISDLRDSIIKGLGLKSEDFKIYGFDVNKALVGRSVAYEFDVEIDNKVLPFKLMEDVKKWDYVDLPIFRFEKSGNNQKGNSGLVEKKKMDEQVPVLAPFQLAGPMELWIQDAKDMRISLPHDVDAGVLKKVILADGAVVTVKGARSVSLRNPVELQLPLNRTSNGFASGLLALAERLRHRALQNQQETSLLSLRIVGPTSLTSPTTSASSVNNRLKLKRLAPGLVELSSASKSKPADALLPIELQQGGEATALLTPYHFTTLWPVASINGSNQNLLSFEAILSSVLGSKANKKGTFKLLKADVSAQTFVKIGFRVEKKLSEDDTYFDGFPKWRTKPEKVNLHFEVLGKVEGDKVVPEKVMQINPVIGEDTIAYNVLSGNRSISETPTFFPPPNPFTL